MRKFEKRDTALAFANQKYGDELVLNDIQELAAQAYERAEPSYQENHD